MFFKKKKQKKQEEQENEIPPRPWICGTPMVAAATKNDKCAIREAYDYTYNQRLAQFKWDLIYKEMDEIERADIEIKIGELRKFQKENGFGPWFRPYDEEDKINLTTND